jgi:hypothetical protein
MDQPVLREPELDPSLSSRAVEAGTKSLTWPSGHDWPQSSAEWELNFGTETEWEAMEEGKIKGRAGLRVEEHLCVCWGHEIGSEKEAGAGLILLVPIPQWPEGAQLAVTLKSWMDGGCFAPGPC